MTITNTNSKVLYDGDGVTTKFVIPFQFYKESDIKAKIIDINEQSVDLNDFIVNKDSSLGYVVNLSHALNSEERILIYRQTKLTQETDFNETPQVNLSMIEKAFDKAALQINELKERADRALTLDIASNDNPNEIIPTILDAKVECSKKLAEVTLLTADVSQKHTEVAALTARAEAAANNAEVHSQSIYQEVVVLDSPVIVLQERKCRYLRHVAAGDSFSIDLSNVKQPDKAITFDLIVAMPAVVAFSFAEIVPLGAGETADANKKWLGGAAPDLSEAGAHWFAFTSHDGGQTWLGSYEGRFIL